MNVREIVGRIGFQLQRYAEIYRSLSPIVDAADAVGKSLAGSERHGEFRSNSEERGVGSGVDSASIEVAEASKIVEYVPDGDVNHTDERAHDNTGKIKQTHKKR